MIKKRKNEYEPDRVSCPGVTLQEILNERGISQSELAQRMGRPTKTVNELIKGKTEITPTTALQLERSLGVPASFWNNREAKYREFLARQAERTRLEGQKEWLKRIPYRFMVNAGWIEDHKDPVEKIREALGYFGTASPAQWDKFVEQRQAAYRKSSVFQCDRGALAAWLRKGEIEAENYVLAKFGPKKFRTALKEIRSLTREGPEVFEKKLIELCSNAGVAVVFVKRPPKVPVNGVVRWLGDNPLIQLSLRYRTDDQLWFTFFHEAGHILKHKKRKTYIDGDTHEGEEEEEANRFAADFLIPPSDYRRLKKAQSFLPPTIKAFAESCGISPGIVVGRLQHDKVLPFKTTLNRLKTKLSWAE